MQHWHHRLTIKKDIRKTERIQRATTKMIPSLKEERLAGFSLPTLKETKRYNCNV